MAEVRCPMCGKLNPADAEVCRYCQARLKPVRPASGSPFTGGEAAANSSEDEPDWLRQMRGDSTANASPGGPDADPADAQPGEDGTVPDWLAKIRSKARTETSGSSNLVDSSQNDEPEPDWMRGLHADEPSAAGGDEPQGDDWLSRLGSASEPAPNPGVFLNDSDRPAASGDDWLNTFSQESGPFAESPSADASSSAGQGTAGFDWSASSLSADEPGETQPPAASPASGTPNNDDWMNSLGSWQVDSAPEEPSGSTGEQQPPDAAFSDWSFFQPGEQLPAAGAETASQDSSAAGDDWLSAFQQEAPAGPIEIEQPTPPSPTGPTADASSGDLPDWLRGMQDDVTSQAEISEPSGELAQPGMDALPTWFDNLNAPPESLSAGESSGAESVTGESSLPDWLSSMPGEEPPAASVQPPASAFPDWMPSTLSGQDQPAEEPFPVESHPPIEQPASDSGLPGWLDSMAGIGAEEPGPAMPFSLESTPSETPAPDAAGQPFVPDGIPDWMAEFKDSAPQLPSEEEPVVQEIGPVENKPFDYDLPDWLSAEEKPTGADAAQPEPGGELAAGAGLIGELGAAESGEQEELAAAELPTWVQAMRPIETAMADSTAGVEGDARIEKSGPLAGMRGILPTDEQVVQYRKPPVYTVKLQVSEKQKENAALLGSLLARETETKSIPQPQSTRTRAVQRIIVAAFLLFVLAVVLLMDAQIAPPPVIAPDEMLWVYDQIDALPADAPVLVAFDYEPGLSGEMSLASQIVLDHLLRKNANIAVISTVPTGPVMADQSLRAAESIGGFNLEGRVQNLGFLPGGTVSLIELAHNPRAAAPRATSGEDPWAEGSFLSGVTTLQDFKQIIVITDRAETGRAWVEQVEPFTGSVPLLFVSSAQAAPMLEPYVASKQADGMVSGLLGGVLYGQKADRQSYNPASLYWGAYQVGILLVFLLILVGGVFSAAVSLIHRKGKA